MLGLEALIIPGIFDQGLEPIVVLGIFNLGLEIVTITRNIQHVASSR